MSVVSRGRGKISNCLCPIAVAFQLQKLLDKAQVCIVCAVILKLVMCAVCEQLCTHLNLGLL
jgi:ribosomal protein S26